MGKKNSDLGLVLLDCFAKLEAWKVTPSGIYRRNFRSRPQRSKLLDGLVRQKSIASFKVNSCRVRILFSPIFSRYSVT